MQFRSTLGAIALLLAKGANARITGISVPTTIKAGEKFTIKSESHAVTPSDWVLTVAYGFAHQSSAQAGSLGTALLQAGSIGGGDQNVDKTVTNDHYEFPRETTPGQYIMTGILYSLIRAPGEHYLPQLDEFRIPVTIGDKTSEEYGQVVRAVGAQQG